MDWSEKQKASGAGGPVTPNPVHDLNVPYEGTKECETPTADLLSSPTPLQAPMQTTGRAQTPGSDSSPLYIIPTGGIPITPKEYSTNDNGGITESKAGPGRPSPYMPPSSWFNQRHPLDVNVAYVESREEAEKGASHHPTTQEFFMPSSGKRKQDDFPSQCLPDGHIPQHDGAGDVLSDAFEMSQGNSQQMLIQEGPESCRIPQFDGPIPDPYDDVLSTPNTHNYQGVANEDYNIVNTPMPNEMQAATPAPVQNEIADADDDDEPLNEDDVEDLDDVDQGEDLNPTNFVLARFDKVTRTKSRWRCTLKDGILHINNKDTLFKMATGQFDF